jgi:hypothetical protein
VSKTADYQAQINNIMDHFDFERVAIVMKRLKWTWGDNGVPTIAQLRARARLLLMDLAQSDNSSLATGGFKVSWRVGQTPTLHLTFYITDYTAGEDEWE